MREIVLDTETTGMDPLTGDRVVEIGCVEVVNGVSTGQTFHVYINPERSMPAEAERVHGLSEAFLADKPVFAEIAGEFMDFIAEDPLVIHNAEFDMKFLNAELKRLGFKAMPAGRAVDTLAIARKKFPGAQASLDALCKRFGIDNSSRTLHGALLDAQLLAEVYLELKGGREPGLGLADANAELMSQLMAAERPIRPARPHAAPAEEVERHRQAIQKMKEPFWKELYPAEFNAD
jgi:DNA polymerase III subunit epsilon